MTSNCGKESYVDTELTTAMTTGACFWSSVLSINSSSPTSCSSRIGSRQHGDTHAPNTGTSWTTSWLGGMTRETYYTQEWCPVQTATLIIGWYAAKSHLPSSLLPRGKVLRRKTASAQSSWPKGEKQSPDHIGGKASLCDSCRAWETMQADEDHTTGNHGWSCWPLHCKSTREWLLRALA